MEKCEILLDAHLYDSKTDTIITNFKECDKKAVGKTEDDLPVCRSCAKKLIEEGFKVHYYPKNR